MSSFPLPDLFFLFQLRRSLSVFSVLLSMLTAGFSVAQEIPLITIGKADYRNSEFRSLEENSRVMLNAASWDAYFPYNSDMVSWLGRSTGSWGDRANHQTFVVANCEPGLTYFLKLKFYASSSSSTSFTASHNGRSCGSVVLSPHQLNSPWVIPFVAQSPMEKITVTHNYHKGGQGVQYALIDQVSLTCRSSQPPQRRSPPLGQDRQIISIGGANADSQEFLSGLSESVAMIDVREECEIESHPSIRSWLGYSRGNWGEDVSTQRFVFVNCLPGVTYKVLVKFHWHSGPDVEFTAHHRGRQCSGVVLTPSAMNGYWEIPFSATGEMETIELSHRYNKGDPKVHYALIDYILITHNLATAPGHKGSRRSHGRTHSHGESTGTPPGTSFSPVPSGSHPGGARAPGVPGSTQQGPGFRSRFPQQRP